MEMNAKTKTKTKTTTTTTPPGISIPIQFCNNTFITPSSSYSPTPSMSTPSSFTSSPNKKLISINPSTPSHNVVQSPCAACKILRRRCVEKCVLAPYFPPTDPLKFTIAHRVFGAANIIKFLQEIAEDQRADAVSSMVYEANARIRDPVYGSAGAICQLQKQISDLQAQLAKTQAELLNIQQYNSNLISLLCTDVTTTQQSNSQLLPYIDIDTCFLDDFDTSWEQPLWT